MSLKSCLSHISSVLAYWRFLMSWPGGKVFIYQAPLERKQLPVSVSEASTGCTLKSSLKLSNLIKYSIFNEVAFGLECWGTFSHSPSINMAPTALRWLFSSLPCSLCCARSSWSSLSGPSCWTPDSETGSLWSDLAWLDQPAVWWELFFFVAVCFRFVLFSSTIQLTFLLSFTKILH